MTSTTLELERRELARRLFIEYVRSRPLLRADFVTAHESGAAIRVPGCLARLQENGIAWGQVADLGDSQIIHLDCLPELSAITGVAVCKHSDLDFDALLPPFADRASGHFSYAHTALQQAQDFSSNWDPLGSASGGVFVCWTGGQDRLKSATGKCRCRSDASNNNRYKWVTSAQPPNDCSVEAVVTNMSPNGTIGPCARYTDGENFYVARLSGANLALLKWVGGTPTTLGTYTTSATGGTIRVECVGTVIKAYLNGTERISVSDSSLASGWAGIRCYEDGSNRAETIDDLTLYVARTGRPAPLAGPLAARAQTGFCLAR